MLGRLGAGVARFTAWGLMWLGLAMLVASLGIRLFYGKISVDQLLLNLIALRADGAGGAGLIWMAVFGIIVLPLALTVLLAVWWRRRARRQSTDENTRSVTGQRVTKAIAVALGVAVVASGTTAFASSIRLSAYVESVQSEVDISDYYVTPVVEDVDERRNLVLIYVEAGEDTLGDAELFETDMLAPLKVATAGWSSIEDLKQYTGGGWTMAGVVATQCGIPLKGNIASSGDKILQELTDGLESYLPGAVCLGDVLAEHGYHNVFYGGADSMFAGKDVFLADHGYTVDMGLADWRAAGEQVEDIRSDWGLSDERLFEYAKTEVSALHAEAQRTGRPFNLTLLTLDTHEPAHLYDSCEVETEEEMVSVYLCSMRLIADFISYMRAEGILHDTAVVVMGDHLKQLGGARAFHDELAEHPNRTIFNRIWIPGTEPQRLRPETDQLSVYPTLLEVAGISVRDHRAGLGVSAFVDTPPEGSAPALGRADYRELLRSASVGFYRHAWNGVIDEDAFSAR